MKPGERSRAFTCGIAFREAVGVRFVGKQLPGSTA